MTDPIPVLFVSHEATRTGAPIMLLHFLRWLRDNSTVEPQIALFRGGPLVEEFAELGPTTVLGEANDWPTPGRAERVLTRRGFGRAALAAQRVHVRQRVSDLHDARTAYLNSAASVRLLHHLPRVETAVAHIHELQSALDWSLRPQDPPLLHRRIDHFVAAADCVADNLSTSYSIDPKNITRIYEFIDPDRVLAPPLRDRCSIRAMLGLDEDALIIGGSGFADWRKGIDLFVQMARTVVSGGREDVHFVWVGDRAGGAEREQLDFDIDHAGLGHRLHIVGLQANSFDWYRTFDVFTLTSREDPYPLVGLETALLEIPIVCFDRAGGMVELVSRSAENVADRSGIVVPYLDVEAMAEAAVGLLDDPVRRASMGRQGADLVRRDHDVEVAGPQLLAVIERVMAENSS